MKVAAFHSDWLEHNSVLEDARQKVLAWLDRKFPAASLATFLPLKHKISAEILILFVALARNLRA